MPIILGGSVGTGSAALSYASVATLIGRCRRWLEDRPFESQTAATITSSATTLSVDDGTLFAKGDWFEWDDSTYEEAFVESVSSNDLTIVRGHLGSTAAAHGNDVRLLIKPRYPRQFLYDEITDAIAQTWPRFWSPVTQSITPVASTILYEANSDAEGLIAASQLCSGSVTDIAIYTPQGSIRPYDGSRIYRMHLRRHMPTATFSSGKAWYIPAFDNLTNALTVTYPAPPSASTVIEGHMAKWVVHTAVAMVARGKQFPRTSGDMSQGDQSTQVLDMGRLAAQMDMQAEAIAPRLVADLMRDYGWSSFNA